MVVKILKKITGQVKKQGALPAFPSKEDVRWKFEAACRKLDVDPEAVKELVIYELTDGTRTSTDLEGVEAYLDGSRFVLRLAHMLDALGCSCAYVLTVGEGHKVRDNWQEMLEALSKSVALWKDYVEKHNIRLKFVGNFAGLEGMDEFKSELAKLEELSKKNSGMVVFVLVNYSADWAYADTRFKQLPNANVIIKHTKGQVNEGLWLPGKLHGNSFVYVQQGSCSSTWTDDQLINFIAMCTRSMVLHKGRQYGKSYEEGEKEAIRQQREVEMSFVHKRLTDKPTKRVVMFSHVGPEIYEF
ncbi:MAG: hypothetical protein QW548_02215 [Candidatus Aenigmatarchaeota archaeon]